MKAELFKEKYRIESNRLKGFDYSTGVAYFITICTIGMKQVLGDIEKGKFVGNGYSEITTRHWTALQDHYDNCIIDEFVIMPNHFHGIIILTNSNMDNTQQHPVSEMIRAFKSFSTKEINKINNTPGSSFWQRNYYDRVIRNENEFERIREYIFYNPLRWFWNKENFEKEVYKG